MASEYRLEIDIALEEAAELKAIELARRVYVDRGGATNRRHQFIRPEEFIDVTEDALMELAEANTLFDEGGISINRIACGRSSPMAIKPGRGRGKVNGH